MPRFSNPYEYSVIWPPDGTRTDCLQSIILFGVSDFTAHATRAHRCVQLVYLLVYAAGVMSVAAAPRHATPRTELDATLSVLTTTKANTCFTEACHRTDLARRGGGVACTGRVHGLGLRVNSAVTRMTRLSVSYLQDNMLYRSAVTHRPSAGLGRRDAERVGGEGRRGAADRNTAIAVSLHDIAWCRFCKHPGNEPCFLVRRCR